MTWVKAENTTIDSEEVEIMKRSKIIVLSSMMLLVGLTIALPAMAESALTGSMHFPRSGQTATLLLSGKILVAGGGDGAGDSVAPAELYDPATGTWEITGSLVKPRDGHTATLLPQGRVLVVGGFGHGILEAKSAELYDPATGSWEITDSVTTERILHTATLLPSGEVLVVGGRHSNGYYASAELYDPTTRTWEETGALITGRCHHTATLLRSGEVLVVGGYGDQGYLASVERYDPVTGTWQQEPGALGTPRSQHTATLLPSGEILVVDGQGAYQNAELYDPATGAWEQINSPGTGKMNHSATLLSSGKVFVVGHAFLSNYTTIDLYDPATRTWTNDGSLVNGRSFHTATLLPSGGVLVAGGIVTGVLSSAEVYDSSVGNWESTGPLSEMRYNQVMTTLSSGKVLVVGGETHSGVTTKVELYDPGTETGTGIWEITGPLAIARHGHTASVLHSGEVLVVGGFGDMGYLSSSELYDPGTGSWRAAAPLEVRRSSHTATTLLSGKVLVAGGHSSDSHSGLVNADLYDPKNDTWETTGSLNKTRYRHTATLLLSGKVLVVAGSRSSSAEIYDPATGTWELTPPLTTPRLFHTATLLPSGKVLVAGAYSYGTTAELYDPATGTWTPTGSLVTGRNGHTATLLPSGRVLVAGGRNDSADYLASAELYNPATEKWRTITPLATPRRDHTATLLPSGKILVAAGYNTGTAELYEPYDPQSYPESRRPVITAVTGTIQYGMPTMVAGYGFGGDSEASDGTDQNSAVNYPLIQIQDLSDGRLSWLAPDPRPNFSDDPMTLVVSSLPPLNPGPHLITVFAAGMPSEPKLVEVPCGLVIDEHPVDTTVPLGLPATFSVENQGGRNFQWLKDGAAIAGATEVTYTTPPVGPDDSGSTYSVMVDAGCTRKTSESATLTVEDNDPPNAAITSPNGGEYWLLSDDETANTELVTWWMSDNIRICRVKVELLYSDDGGVTYLPVPENGGLLFEEGPGGTCRFGEQPETTSLEYTVPTTPPSGTPGSLYKIQVQLTDHAGLTTTVPSSNPFFIVQPNPDSVKSLILANRARMISKMGITPYQADELLTKLNELASHPRVQGLVVDFGYNTDLAALYEVWDTDAENAPDPDPDLANLVLFGCHGDPLPQGCPEENDGIHDVIRNLLEAYTGVEYLILVGDDRIIPMARIEDRTGYLESKYTSDDPFDPDAGLTNAGTTVGQALADDHYLSDDPLGTLRTIRPEDLDADEKVFVPDLAVGRLVETREEIITAIATFISQDGVLDLSLLPADTGHKTLVTGYDFLLDSAKEIRRGWKNALGLAEPHQDDALAPVDGQLISRTWGEDTVEDRRIALLTHLSGNAGERYGVMNLNGHATHYEEGVPGQDIHDIEGLDAADLYGLDLAGGIVYAVGCHGGLPVAGSSDSADHPLDLPQTMLANGVMAYVANSGYGWGLLHGIGLSERMVEILTEEITGGGTVVVGDAVRESKLRYFLESSRFDDYDAKTSMQWTFYGFPMYAVKTGIAADGTVSQFAGTAPAADERGAVKRFEGVTVVRRYSAVGSPFAGDLPDYLSRLELDFDFTAARVYAKHNAAGDVLPEGTHGCPPPLPDEPAGCYYRLNGLATGEADLPLQPYFVYDSRLSGTSQHGVLWLGGAYDEEDGWVPVIGELVSNGGDFSDHGSLPRKIYRKPGTPGRRILDAADDCRPTDLDLSSVVVETGELLKVNENDPEYTIQRTYREIDLEVYYFNNTADGKGNCDRTGPLFAAGPYHQVTGTTIDWAVPVSDEGGVWRVVVVYDDQTLGRWVPVDLVDDGTGTWRGSLRVTGASRLTYFLQAVDKRGNVSWVQYVPEAPASSGVPLGIPLPIDVPIVPGTADVTVAGSDAPDPVMAGDPLAYTITVSNLGPDVADGIVVTDVLPGGVSFQLSGGSGWSCAPSAGTVTCTRDTLAVGAAPAITILVTAPGAGGWITNTATVAADNDPYSDNDTATQETLVVDATMTDLAVVKDDGGVPAIPGQPIHYSILVTNNGPNAVLDATVSDVFPSPLRSVVWSCVATEGSSCTANGSGDISDTVALPPEGAVLYTITATVAVDVDDPNVINTASVSVPAPRWDYAPGNDVSTVVTRVIRVPIFADGFESGDPSAWSSVVPAAVIRVWDQTPEDDGRYFARFVVDLHALGKSAYRSLVVVDGTTSLAVLALGLVREDGPLRLIGEVPAQEGAEIDVVLPDETRTIAIDWIVAEGRFELRVDGVRRWSGEASRGSSQID